MQSTLTQADVAKLLAEPSPTVRAELAGKLGHEIDNPDLNQAEAALAQDIVRIMAKDVEANVRRALAENLRGAAHLPHDVALKLANDIESVALPILESSQVLTDADLIEIVRSGAAAKQEVIAGREGLGESVADVLVTTASEKAVAKLMDNTTAQISEKSLSKAVDRFAASDLVKEKIVKRPTLPPTVTERLVTMVADTMRDYLVAHHQVSPTVASDIVMQSRERAIIGLTGKSSVEELEKLIAQMNANKRLTPTLVIRALCMGDVAFFEMAIAVMANIPVVNARILIHDAGQLGLKSLYERAGMPPDLLPAVRVAIDVVHETEMTGEEHDRERYRARVIERILTKYEDVGADENMGADNVDYLLGKLSDIVKLGT
ncbi:MAG: DUF2336 domain-containing protein [Alphaproteobacteria bacterium]|nr:DUF2336 domain-containing protein [Alphaproteobacteria bacterium]